jgi:hypothetical protein
MPVPDDIKGFMTVAENGKIPHIARKLDILTSVVGVALAVSKRSWRVFNHAQYPYVARSLRRLMDMTRQEFVIAFKVISGMEI